MNPGFMWHWKTRHHDSCGGNFAFAGCGPTGGGSGLHGSRGHRYGDGSGFTFDFSGGGRRFEDPVFGASGFGVRRPLRFLAHQLDLSEAQVDHTARILERLKIERAQASVDLRRQAADLADAFDGPEFGGDRADAVRASRVETAARVQDALTLVLRELHQLLDAEQREALAGLIRRGELRV